VDQSYALSSLEAPYQNSFIYSLGVAHSHEVKFCNSFPGFTENRWVEEKSMYKEVCSFKQLDLYY